MQHTMEMPPSILEQTLGGLTHRYREMPRMVIMWHLLCPTIRGERDGIMKAQEVLTRHSFTASEPQDN